MNISSVSDKAAEIATRAKEHLGKAASSEPAASSAGQASGNQAGVNDAVELSEQASALSDEMSCGMVAEDDDPQAGRVADAGDDDPQAGRQAAAEDERSADVESLARAMVGEDGDTSTVKVVGGGDGDDTIAVKNGKNGSLVVTVNGKSTTYSAEDAQNLILDGGAGNDSIVVDKGVTMGLNITGGDGDDMLVGGSGNDRMIDGSGNNAFAGRDGDDTMIGNGGTTQEASEGTPWYSKLWKAVVGGSVATNGGNYMDGGKGADYLEGGLGNDTLKGGSGNDVVYGLSGNDTISGGAGRDYIDGGNGNDAVKGDGGDDMLFGGNGDDSVLGGNGADVIVGGRGVDNINGGKGADEVTRTADDVVVSSSKDTVVTTEPIDVPSNLQVSGTAAYQERVTSDLDALAATSTGQTMLNGLKDSGKTVTFADIAGGNSCSYYNTGVLNDDGSANVGCDSQVNYNTSRISTGGSAEWSDRPPIVGMYHEMAHSYDAANGILDGKQYDYDGNVVDSNTKGAEFQAVGIDNGSVTQNPDGISENSLRDFLNLAHRDKY